MSTINKAQVRRFEPGDLRTMEKRYSKGFARAGCGRQIVRREQIEAHVYLPELKIDANSGAAPFQEAATAQVKT